MEEEQKISQCIKTETLKTGRSSGAFFFFFFKFSFLSLPNLEWEHNSLRTPENPTKSVPLTERISN